MQKNSGFIVTLSLVLWNFFSTPAKAEPEFWMTCGGNTIIDLTQPKTTYLFSTGNFYKIGSYAYPVPQNLLELFEVPELNRKVYERVKLELSFDKAECSAPTSSDLFSGVRCVSKKPKTLRLFGSVGYSHNDRDKYPYHHDKAVASVSLTGSVYNAEQKNTFYKVDINIDGVKFSKIYGHHCSSTICSRSGTAPYYSPIYLKNPSGGGCSDL